MTLLKILLFVLLGYYALKLLAKWAMPRLLRYVTRKAKERFESQFGDYRESRNTFYEAGKTAIVKKPTRKGKSSKKVGEYINFEEIDGDFTSSKK